MQGDLSTAQRYYEVAQERFNDAYLLFKHEQYSGASYLAGCAIEAMFWAFIPEHEAIGKRGRHDLQKLYEAGLGARRDAIYLKRYRMGSTKDSAELRKFEAESRSVSRYLTDARLRWSNSYRYYPDSVLRSGVKRDKGLSAGLTGDVLKGSVNVLLEACQYFMGLGIKKKNWIR